MNNQEQKSIKDAVLDKIKDKEVKMRPRTYFVLRTVLAIFGTIVAALFILYLVSFIMFATRTSGVWFLPKFGFPALGIFFRSLPWILIIMALVLIVVLELFVKHFAFVWRRPVLYSVLGIIILTILGSFIIFRTNLHSDIFWKARQGDMPLPGTRQFYRGFGAPKLSDVHYGIVSGISDTGFTLETQRNEVLNIFVASTTRVLSAKEIEKGDRVLILGNRTNGTVQALDVRIIKDEFDIFNRRPPNPMLPR